MIAVMTFEEFYDASPYLPSETILGQPLISTDGRCACCHPFSEEDIEYLEYMGAVMADELPGDFVVVGVDDGIGN